MSSQPWNSEWNYWKQSITNRKHVDAEAKRLGTTIYEMSAAQMDSLVETMVKRYGTDHRDVNGNIIQLHQRVAVAVTGRHPSIQLCTGVVTKLGKKKISFKPDNQTNAAYLPNAKSVEPERCLIL